MNYDEWKTVQSALELRARQVFTILQPVLNSYKFGIIPYYLDYIAKDEVSFSAFINKADIDYRFDSKLLFLTDEELDVFVQKELKATNDIRVSWQ